MKTHPGSERPGKVDFDSAPFLVIWETTRACDLACRHCRAEAVPERVSGELSTEEGRRLLDQAAAMGTPIAVLSGGDPLKRPDLEALVAHGKGAGLRMGTIPAATPLLTRARLAALKEAGLDQVAFSLDAPTAARHDGFRRVEGTFERALDGIGWAHELGLPVQVNTCFGAWNFGELEAMIALVRGLRVVFWEVFFLVPTGRGRELDGMTPAQFEAAYERLYRLSQEADFVVKLTEGQPYRRFVLRKREGFDLALGRVAGARGGMGQSAEAVNAGKGFLFVDHLGNVCPSGFLPLPVGNVRSAPLAELYRRAPLMRALRDPERLEGRCGACEYARACGGSRSRAWAVTGDPFAADPACAFAFGGRHA